MRQILEYRFGPYRLNTATRDFYKGEELLRTPPLVLNLIVTLLIHRDRVVSKGELIQALWPHGVASDGSLAQAVRRARQLLGDSEAESTWIRTSQRVGYRFVGPVDVLELANPASRAPVVPPRPPEAREARPARSQYGEHQRARDALTRWRSQPRDVLPLFVVNDTVTMLEEALPAVVDDELVAVQLPLAWHLRQRDTRRALELADACDAILQHARRPDAAALRMRVRLIHAEVNMLVTGERHLAREAGLRVLAEAKRLGAAVLACDACWLLATVAHDDGNPKERDSHWQEAIRHAEVAGDEERSIAAQLQTAICEVRQVGHVSDQKWAEKVRIWRTHMNPGIVALSAAYLVFSAISRLDLVTAIAEGQAQHEAWQSVGHWLGVVNAGHAVAATATNAGDYETAAEWSEPTLELARSLRWPQSLEVALFTMGALLEYTHQFEAAREVLDEALRYAQLRPNSRSFHSLLLSSFAVNMELGNFSAALEVAEESERIAQKLQATDALVVSSVRRAKVLLKLGRIDEAHSAALAAMKLAEETDRDINDESAIIMLMLADIHRLKDLPAPADCTAASPSLHYILRAKEWIESQQFGGKSPFLRATSAEYARLGDYANAYRYESEAIEALAQEHADEASKRTVAMKVRHDTERMRAESDFHRQVAAANAQRAQALSDMSVTLERLGDVGRDITNKLNATDVFAALGDHVQGLLDTASVAIYVVDERQSLLMPAFGEENGEPLPLQAIAIDDATSFIARCARERREHLIEPDAGGHSHVPGTAISRSALYGPLSIGSRLIGVATIQSSRTGAYGERERLIFRSLCAYTAIALDNANAYRELVAALRELKDTRAKLIERNEALDHARNEIEELSFRDPLTGLRNRRFLTQQIERDVALCLRDWRNTSATANASEPQARMVFFLIDIDHFKSVNDDHGHAAGDAVLTQVARRLEATFRQSDLVVRWGGEEFLAVATQAATDTGSVLAERLLRVLGDEPFHLPNGTMLSRTCSIGIVSLPFIGSEPHALTWQHVVELADRAMYFAKQSGRNGWCEIGSRPNTSTNDAMLLLGLPVHEAASLLARSPLALRRSAPGATLPAPQDSR